MLAVLPVSVKLLLMLPPVYVTNPISGSFSTLGCGLETVTTPISVQIADPGEVSRCHFVSHGLLPFIVPPGNNPILAAVRATLVTPVPVVTNKVPATV